MSDGPGITAFASVKKCTTRYEIIKWNGEKMGGGDGCRRHRRESRRRRRQLTPSPFLYTENVFIAIKSTLLYFLQLEYTKKIRFLSFCHCLAILSFGTICCVCCFFSSFVWGQQSFCTDILFRICAARFVCVCYRSHFP